MIMLHVTGECSRTVDGPRLICALLSCCRDREVSTVPRVIRLGNLYRLITDDPRPLPDVVCILEYASESFLCPPLRIQRVTLDYFSFSFLLRLLLFFFFVSFHFFSFCFLSFLTITFFH